MQSPPVGPRPTTGTERDQKEVEQSLRSFFDKVIEPLHTTRHAAFLGRNLRKLPDRWQALDSSRPWLCYWSLHAADILGVLDKLFVSCPATDIAEFILMCLTEDADTSEPASDPCSGGRRMGFGGGPGQFPHLAASYAAVCTLCIAQQGDVIQRIDRAAVQRWLVSLRLPDGSFRMHRGGEGDLRATYCACVVATLLNLDLAIIFPDACRRYLARCQTYEGGFGSCVDGGGEAHGGYTQCGIAAATILDCCDQLDLPNFRRFCAMRQLPYESGFCGRPNKLVDSCYSFWLGSSCVLAEAATIRSTKLSDPARAATLHVDDMVKLDYCHYVDLRQTQVDVTQLQSPPADSPSFAGDGDWFFDQRELMYYVLQCCQDTRDGGCRDKPTAYVDFYHSCYSLSGSSIASNNLYLACADTQLVKECDIAMLPNNSTEDDGPRAIPPDISPALANTQVLPYAPEASPMMKGWSSRGKTGRPSAAAPPLERTRGVPMLKPVSPVFNVCRDKLQWMFAFMRPQGAVLSLLNH